MNAWIGNAVGSAIGLIALLFGALGNAWLTRRRDASLRKEKAASIAAALGAEIGAYAAGIWSAMGSVTVWADTGATIKAERLRMADPVVWPKLADQLGELRPEDAGEIARIWQNFESLRRDLEHFAVNPPDAQTAVQKLEEATRAREWAESLSSRLMPSP